MRTLSAVAASLVSILSSPAGAAGLHAGQAVHPVHSTAGCSSSMIERKVAADLAVDKASADADDLMEKNHCTAIIGADAGLGPGSPDIAITYRLVLDHGDGLGLFVEEMRTKEDPNLDGDMAFYAPISAFTPDT